MEPVIRGSRVAMGRMVLQVPGQAAALPAVVPSSGAGECGATSSPDLAALRRMVEQELSEQWHAQHREVLALEREAARRDGKVEGMAEGREASEAARHAAEQSRKQAEAERHERAQAVLQAMQQSHATALVALQNEVGMLAFEAVCRIAGCQAVSRPRHRGNCVSVRARRNGCDAAPASARPGSSGGPSRYVELGGWCFADARGRRCTGPGRL